MTLDFRESIADILRVLRVLLSVASNNIILSLSNNSLFEPLFQMQIL